MDDVEASDLVEGETHEYWDWVESRPELVIVGDKPFPFLSLPAELREFLYIRFFDAIHGAEFYDGIWWKRGFTYICNLSSRRWPREDRNLLQTCRQVYQEASSVLYKNEFRLSTERSPRHHPYAFGPIAHKIQNLTIHFTWHEYSIDPDDVQNWDLVELLPTLKSFRSLKKVQILWDRRIFTRGEMEEEMIFFSGAIATLMEFVSPSVAVEFDLVDDYRHEHEVTRGQWLEHGERVKRFRRHCRKWIKKLSLIQGIGLIGEDEKDSDKSNT